MHRFAYALTRLACRVLFGLFTRVRVMGHEHIASTGAMLLASNHISHFDPPILTAAARRKVDWMAMREMFENPLVRAWLWSVDTFAVDRFVADRAAVRTALARLKAGRLVGMFPEGGLRDGPTSILNGAPPVPGLGALAQMSDTPIVPCVILGTDRLYAPHAWIPFRRVRVWIAFGPPIEIAGRGKDARDAIDTEFVDKLRILYAEARAHFNLIEDDLPQPAQRRKGRL